MTKVNEQRLARLKGRLDTIQTKLNKLIREIELTNETSNSFWSAKTREVKKLYEEMRYVFASMFPKMVESEYYTAMNTQIQSIKQLKFKKPINVNYSDVQNSNSNKQTVKSILTDGVSTFLIGIDSGNKTLNRFMRLTQQLIIEEDKVNKLVEDGFFEKGSSYGSKQKLWKELADKLDDGKAVTIIDKNGNTRNYDPKYYAEMVARTKIMEANNTAVVNTALEVGADLVEISSHNTQTPLCQEFEGKIYSISGKDPDFPQLEEIPPFHPNPFTKDTEIYTDSGWKFVSDVTTQDSCLSLNPETFNIEFVKVIGKVKRFSETVIKFKNKICEIKVAHDHNMFYQTDWDSKHNQNRFRFVQAQELLAKKSGRFFASSDYESNVLLNKEYCFFIGNYLSDGSVDRNYVVISKTNRNIPDRQVIIHNLKKWRPDIKLILDKNSIRFNDKQLAAYLKQFGKCDEKFIPAEIMGSSVESIRAFLDGFVLCDGNVKKGKIWKESKFDDTRTYFTTSKRMSEQLGELIVKIGKRPSFRIQKPSGKPLNFPNRLYIPKKDLYIISECTNRFISLQNMNIKEIEYNDYTYCVSLEKFFTLLTRTNGQVVWAGNCLHSMTVVFREVLERRGIDKYIDFANGDTEEHPTKKSFIPVSERE